MLIEYVVHLAGWTRDVKKNERQDRGNVRTLPRCRPALLTPLSSWDAAGGPLTRGRRFGPNQSTW